MGLEIASREGSSQLLGLFKLLLELGADKIVS